MKIKRAENWNRKKRKCEHCASFIEKDEPIALLYSEVIELPVTIRGIAFHEECLREELEDLITSL